MWTIRTSKLLPTTGSLRQQCMGTDSRSFRVLVIGGGSAGIPVAARLGRSLPRGSVALVEPKDVHYYQPMWTLVGGGIKRLADSARSMASIMPKRVDWIQDEVIELSPAANSIKTASGKQISYDYLVVAPGVQLAFDRIKGLPEALQSDPMVCSNYSATTVEKTIKAFERFQSGNALFTVPNTPIKCPGAAQKIMYLADDYFRKHGKRDKANIQLQSALGVIFGVPKYAQCLSALVQRRSIETHFGRNLVEINPNKKEATFEQTATGGNQRIIVPYELIHVVPPHVAPAFLKPLADLNGFVDVDKHTLQSNHYPNVFALGDCINAPCSKTGAAVAHQNRVVFDNLMAVMNAKNKQSLPQKYEGYSSCPIVTSYGKTIMAEFNYNLEPVETFPFDQGQERRSMYLVKVYGLPWIYWNLMLRGFWSGPSFFRKLLGGGR